MLFHAFFFRIGENYLISETLLGQCCKEGVLLLQTYCRYYLPFLTPFVPSTHWLDARFELHEGSTRTLVPRQCYIFLLLVLFWVVARSEARSGFRQPGPGKAVDHSVKVFMVVWQFRYLNAATEVQMARTGL